MSIPISPGISDADAFADECHYFALALHARVGGTLAFVANRGGDGRILPGHVVVSLPDGRHADAEGTWDGDALLSAWNASEIVPVTRREVERSLGRSLSAHARSRISAADAVLAGEDAYMASMVEIPADATAPRP